MSRTVSANQTVAAGISGGDQGARTCPVSVSPASVLATKLDNVLGKAPHPPQPPHSGFVPRRRHSKPICQPRRLSERVAGLPAWPLCSLVEAGHAPGSRRRAWDNGLARSGVGEKGRRRPPDLVETSSSHCPAAQPGGREGRLLCRFAIALK